MSIHAAVPSVLVVSGDRDVRKIVHWILDEFDVPHHAVPNWRAAIGFVTHFGPSLVIADWDDVQGDGKGLAALLRTAWNKPIPLIILSGRADAEELAEDLGAVAGLRKPLNGTRLLAVVAKVVAVPG